MVESATDKKKKSGFAAFGKLAKDAAISIATDAAVTGAIEKGLTKGVKEVSRNKELRKAGTDLLVNYAVSKNRHGAGTRSYRDEDDEIEEHRPRSSKNKGKAKEMYSGPSRMRDREGYEDVQYRSSYDRGPPPPSSRPRKSSFDFGDSWFERAFGAAPSWSRNSGFKVNETPPSSRRPGPGGLQRSMSNPGRPRTESATYPYSHGGHGYGFRDPSSHNARGSSFDDASPYDTDYRPRQLALREEEDRQRELLARQAELGGVAVSHDGRPLYGYRPGEEPGSHAGPSNPSTRASSGFARFFSPLSSAATSPATTPGAGPQTPMENRLGHYSPGGSGLYSKVFTRTPDTSIGRAAGKEHQDSSPAVTPNEQPSKASDQPSPASKFSDGMRDDSVILDLPSLPRTRYSLPPEMSSKTQAQAPQQRTEAAQSTSQHPSSRSNSQRGQGSPAVVQHTSKWPIPHITKDTSISTLAFAARCSQIIYHLSTTSSVRHYLKNYDSHSANPTLLEANFADPTRGTKNWAVMRRKKDGAMIVAVRGSGRGLSRGTDYTSDLSWLDDEEWLSDMMLNLKARKWGGSLSRRNSTGGSGSNQQQAQSSTQQQGKSSRSGSTRRPLLHLSSIKCADGSAFEAHEGFLKCAMAMYSDVTRALDKKFKMWSVLAASSGIRIELGGKGAPGGGKSSADSPMETVSPPELIFTGHSAGGAVASLLYVLLDTGNRELLDRFGKVSVLTFGAAAGFPHPRSAPLTHANTHSSRRSIAGRIRDVHLTILHKDDPIPRMDTLYALSLLETALGGPRNANAALMALSTIAAQSKDRQVAELIRLVKAGAEQAKEMRKREKEARRIGRAAEEVVGGGPGGAAAAAAIPDPLSRVQGMEMWPAGDLFLLALAPSSSSGSGGGGTKSGKDKPGGNEVMSKSILKTSSGAQVQTKGGSGGARSGAQAEIQLFTYTHAQLARSKPTDWASHRIAKYFSILEEIETRLPSLRV
ncbi:hypothetical protein OC846_001615 [Tilletia horrida]|uniref:Fungal lipase-type domain-containing protein n=1 Tax=Tilletia horrida TaxID=155126 RepID=A0AAN6GW00_9BASI|nr:hypothetical protein OC845_005343 [Tilletia horrida]KAK0555650.1 hypothetical protein OC846_001615 [Tilletia horrida]KAK0568551.1 hypothetical protein OC861_001799 [Tilletia horrida]